MKRRKGDEKKNSCLITLSSSEGLFGWEELKRGKEGNKTLIMRSSCGGGNFKREEGGYTRRRGIIMTTPAPSFIIVIMMYGAGAREFYSSSGQVHSEELSVIIVMMITRNRMAYCLLICEMHAHLVSSPFLLDDGDAVTLDHSVSSCISISLRLSQNLRRESIHTIFMVVVAVAGNDDDVNGTHAKKI